MPNESDLDELDLAYDNVWALFPQELVNTPVWRNAMIAALGRLQQVNMIEGARVARKVALLERLDKQP
jgi:hypothetical protein